MYTYQYDYTVLPDNSTKVFKETCNTIKNKFANIISKDLLVDVDGTTIQEYIVDDKSIVIYDDYDVGAVYVKSQINLNNLYL